MRLREESYLKQSFLSPGGDIQDAAGSLQLCAGQIAGAEAAVHATRESFLNENTEAVLLVDASNAFNALNRQVALRNIKRLCPSIATALINTYRQSTDLFVDGSSLLSQEGTTQGDPLAIPMYALATLPLIRKLPDIQQVWYADAASGESSDLWGWWDKLLSTGPAYGYQLLRHNRMRPTLQQPMVLLASGTISPAPLHTSQHCYTHWKKSYGENSFQLCLEGPRPMTLNAISWLYQQGWEGLAWAILQSVLLMSMLLLSRSPTHSNA